MPLPSNVPLLLPFATTTPRFCLVGIAVTVVAGHVWGVFHGLNRLSVETSQCAASSNPVTFSEDVQDGARACVKTQDSASTATGVPAVNHQHMHALLREVAVKGYAPVADKHDPRLQMGSQLNVSAAVLQTAMAARGDARTATRAGSPRDSGCPHAARSGVARRRAPASDCRSARERERHSEQRSACAHTRTSGPAHSRCEALSSREAGSPLTSGQAGMIASVRAVISSAASIPSAPVTDAC